MLNPYGRVSYATIQEALTFVNNLRQLNNCEPLETIPYGNPGDEQSGPISIGLSDVWPTARIYTNYGGILVALPGIRGALSFEDLPQCVNDFLDQFDSFRMRNDM